MNTSIRSARFSLRRAAMLAAAAGLLAAAPALAQSAAGGSFDRPLAAVAQPATPRASGDTTIVISSSENGKSYSVKVHNNEVSAEIDGQPVPADRIDRKGDVIIIKDKDGKAEKTFDVGVRSARTRSTTNVVPLRNFSVQTTPDPVQGGAAWSATAAEPPNPPPVMVGVTMSDPDGALAEHLGLKEDEVFVIDRVVDDLPAAKAGLEPLDVVIAIDGQKPASQDKFRETLRSKKAGDTLELTIVRKGAEKKIKIELAAYDRAKLAPAGVGQFMITPSPDATGAATHNDWLRAMGSGGNNDEARRLLEEALKSVQQSDKIKGDEARQQAEKALKQAIESLSQSRARSAERYRALSDAMGKDTIVLGDQPGQVFAMPGDRDVTRRLERLSDQLEKLNHRLDEIEHRLSEKK